MSAKDMGTVRYVSRKLNGLHFNDGNIPYKDIDSILKKIGDHRIYTFSDIAVETLQTYIPYAPKIKNIQDMGFEMPKELQNSNCFRKHISRYCAKSKSREGRDFMKFFD